MKQRLPIKLGFSESGLGFETYSSHSSEASAEKSRNRLIGIAKARKHQHLYQGWWVIVDTTTKPWKLLSALGMASKEGVPMPHWKQDA